HIDSLQPTSLKLGGYQISREVPNIIFSWSNRRSTSGED
ncbi:unnamed protein product, partial [Musa acuminata subsp. burmannicoides]